MLYIVKRAPKGRNAEVFRHIVVIVDADTASQAIKKSGLNVSTNREFCKPVAEVIEIGKQYYI